MVVYMAAAVRYGDFVGVRWQYSTALVACRVSAIHKNGEISAGEDCGSAVWGHLQYFKSFHSQQVGRFCEYVGSALIALCYYLATVLLAD